MVDAQQAVTAKVSRTLSHVTAELDLSLRITNELGNEQDVRSLFDGIAALEAEKSRKRLGKDLVSKLCSAQHPLLARLLPELLARCCRDNALSLDPAGRASLAMRAVVRLHEQDRPAEQVLCSVFPQPLALTARPHGTMAAAAAEALMYALGQDALSAAALAGQAFSAAMLAAESPPEDEMRKHVLNVAKTALARAYQKADTPG